ncbi:MAG TPA: MFS transporter [Chloroflexota bacterium]|nr:MFS transporter [Chloroflexota bacterium]
MATTKSPTAESVGFWTYLRNKDIGYFPRRKLRYWLLGLVVPAWTVQNFEAFKAGPVLPHIVQYDGISTASSAGLASMFWLTFTVALVFSGWMCDKLHVRKIVGTLGGIATGVMFFVIAFLPKTHSIGEPSLIWALTGICAGFIYPAYTALISENAEAISPFGVGPWLSPSRAKNKKIKVEGPPVDPVRGE